MGAAMTRSEFRTLVRDIEDNGFTFVRTTKHQHLYADRCGNFVAIGKTPSDPRALANARADLRRAIKARTEEQDRTETENQGMNTNSADLTGLIDEPATPAAAELVECGRCGTSKVKDNFRIHYRTHQPFGMCKQCIAEVQKTRPPTRLPKLDPPSLPPLRRLGAADVARATRAKSAGPDPESMAARLLVARHREEYDRLLVDMMTALGWES